MKKLIVILGLIALMSCEKEPLNGCGYVVDKRLNDNFDLELKIDFGDKVVWQVVTASAYLEFNIDDYVCYD